MEGVERIHLPQERNWGRAMRTQSSSSSSSSVYYKIKAAFRLADECQVVTKEVRYRSWKQRLW
jgi:hypothetical protein